MKQITKMLAAIMAIGMMFSCEPVEDRDSLPAVTLNPSEINISVTKDPANPNRILMKNLTTGIIPYWNYTNAANDDLGHSNQNEASVVLPFAGTYTFYFTAYTRGGAVTAVPVPITIKENYEEFFSEPEWNWLTNGTEGKTWVLDMESPLGYGHPDYPEKSNDSWFPTYAGNEWLMVNKNWGEMTFSLDGNYNVNVTQTAIANNTQTDKKGTFSYNVAEKSIVFNGGVEMLYGGDYYLDVSNWKKVKVIELTENSMRLAVLRDQDRAGQSLWQLIYHFKPKQ